VIIRTPRSRIIVVVSIFAFAGIAVFFGAWVIPAIMGAFAAGMYLVARDLIQRHGRAHPPARSTRDE
jgi:Kef-type K+ transport system membrane component KefB